MFPLHPPDKTHECNYNSFSSLVKFTTEIKHFHWRNEKTTILVQSSYSKMKSYNFFKLFSISQSIIGLFSHTIKF